VSVVNGSLEDYGTVERAINENEVEAVFHLGAQAIVGAAQRSPLPTFEANIRGTYNVLEACRIHPDLITRVVIASSDKAYGEQPVMPYTEDMPLAGRNPYEVSKSCADLIAQSYNSAYGLPVGIARCGNIYGGGDLNWNRIVPGTIRLLLEGKPPIVRSDGRYIRDYIYVKDVALAYIGLAEALSEEAVDGEAFNFGNDIPMSVLDIVKLIQSTVGRCDLEPVVLGTAQGEIHTQYLSSEKARKVLRWKPSYDIEEGLSETAEWYREFLAN
jgi:CDP-glucose 4,6-dehydratase